MSKLRPHKLRWIWGSVLLLAGLTLGALDAGGVAVEVVRFSLGDVATRIKASGSDTLPVWCVRGGQGVDPQ